ncbi:ABC transporter substrate-binding protein [Paraburkholderia sp. D1E]|uniref:ABC transporter substrate-binding protein n=1 Tax=Paraburkholderia sp. D1E TaxID=3461398 RepID=UPI004045986C
MARRLRWVLGAVGGLVAGCALPALATPTLYLGSYGGSTQDLFQKKIIPAFEANHDVKIVYVPGNSTDTLAKLQAQKSKEELDVVLLDDGPMYQATQFGFCDKLQDAPVYKDLYDIGKMNANATSVGVVATGLVYNTEAFRKAGLPKPDSWEALTDKRLRQKIAIPPINNTYGLQTLLTYARLRKGSDHNIDPGMTALAKEVGPNVLAWEPSPGKMTEMFQNGDITLAVWGSGRVAALKATGFPVEFVYPKEGSPAMFTAVCPVIHSDVAALSQQFIQFLLTPQVQAWLAEGQGWGPVNKNTKLTPQVAATVPYTPEQIGRLVKTDWTYVNEKRSDWTNRWNRTVER